MNVNWQRKLRQSDCAANVSTNRMIKRLTAAAGMITLLIISGPVKSRSQSINFQYTGEPWSYQEHSGWTKYYGGPVIGFYYAPSPVFVVPGYTAASDYTNPYFWFTVRPDQTGADVAAMYGSLNRSVGIPFNSSYHAGVHNRGSRSRRGGGRRHSQ